MGWSFRKSANFGPLRINFSKSGIGASIGVKGARISSGPRGTYVNLGSNGFYYRKRIDVTNINQDQKPTIPHQAESEEPHTITTVNFDHLTDTDSQDFIRELEKKNKKISFFRWFGVFPSVIMYSVILLYTNADVGYKETYEDVFRITHQSVHIRDIPSTSGEILFTVSAGQVLKVIPSDTIIWVKVLLPASSSFGYVHESLGVLEKKLISKIPIHRSEAQPILTKLLYIISPLAMIALCVWLFQVDKKRLTLEINYQMDESVEKLYKQFLECFKDFASSKRVWQKLHSQRSYESKYNAGASELIQRSIIRAISLNQKPTNFLITNVSIPHIGLVGNSLFFFPERIVMKRGNRFAALQYKNVRIQSDFISFIETESVMSDAEVTGYTWKYVNKNGGPDKRFKDNVKIPICKYSQYHLWAESGLNEIISTSRPGAMDQLVAFIKVIGNFQENMKNELPSKS